MTKEDVLRYFDDINFAYNDCSKYDLLSNLLDELVQEPKPMEKFENAKDHIFKLAGDYKCWDNRLTQDEALELCHILEQEPCEDCISRQAVINHICQSKDCYKENCKGNIYKRCPDTMWVYDLPSINPQEPCEDCISREWIKTAIHMFYNGLTEEDIQSCLDSAPSVKPKAEQESKTQFVEKSNFDIKQYNTDLQSAYDCGKASQEQQTGHWIMHDKHRECSVCKAWLMKDMPRNSYCPNCGAKMEG